MRVNLSLARLFLLGCCAYAVQSQSIVPEAVGDESAESQQGPGYMLAFPMDEAGMVAAESGPAPQLAAIVKEEAATTLPANTVSIISVPESKPEIKATFQQPSEADRRRKIEEMRKILGLPANIGQKPKPAFIQKPKPLFFPSLMKVLPRLDSSPLSSLPLALIRRSDEEGPKMLQGLLRQAATVFMRRALHDDEPNVQDVTENKGKKDNLFFFLDDDKEDTKEEEKKGSNDEDDDDDDDDIAFIPLPRPMLPMPGPFRSGFPTPPFGLPRRIPQMGPRRQPFPPMGPSAQLRRALSREAPDQPVVMFNPFMAPQPMMVPEQSLMEQLAFAQSAGIPHPMMMLPPAPLPFHPHPFMLPHPMMPPHPMMMPPHPMMMPPHPMMMPPHPSMMPPHPMMIPPHPPMMPPHPMMMPPHPPMMMPPHPPMMMPPHPFFMDPHLVHPQLLPNPFPHPVPFPQQPMLLPQQPFAPHPFMFRPEFNPNESPEGPEGSPFMLMVEEPQPKLHHQHHHHQHQSQQVPQFQAQPPTQMNARTILSPLRRMQMLRELIMARSMQMSPRTPFHLPVPPRFTPDERDTAQSMFRPNFVPMGM